MNTETLFLIVDGIFAAAALIMVSKAVLTTIQDRADCQSREQRARGIGSTAR